MIKTILVFLLISGVSTAQETEKVSAPVKGESVSSGRLSEAHYMPSKSEFAAEFKPSSTSEERVYNDSTVKHTRSVGVTNLSIGLGYGLSKVVSAKAVFQHRTTSINSDGRKFEYRGLGDLQASVNYASEEREGLIASMRFTLSPADAEYASAKKSGNSFSGGNSVEPYLAFEKQATPGLRLGGFTSYRIMGERSGKYVSTAGRTEFTDKSSGGNILTVGALAEGAVSKLKIGTTVAFKDFASENYSSSDDNAYVYDSKSALAARAYCNIPIGTVELVPELGYDELLTKNINGLSYSAASSYSIAATLRTIF